MLFTMGRALGLMELGELATALTQGRKCLVLSRRRDHLTALAGLLPEAEALIMRGGTGATDLASIRAWAKQPSSGPPSRAGARPR